MSKGKRRTRVRKHRVKYVWCGNSSRVSSFSGIQGRLKEMGFECVNKYTNQHDMPHKLPSSVGFVIGIGRGPVCQRALKLAIQHDIPCFLLARNSLNEILDELRDSGFIDDKTPRPDSLHGFHDDKKAQEVSPVTTPVLTKEDMEKIEQAKERHMKEQKKEAAKKKVKDTLAVHHRGSEVFVRDMAHTGRGQKLSRPMTVDGDTVFQSATRAAEFLEVGSSDLCRAAMDGKSLNGIRVSYSTLHEALTLPGAFREAGMDKDEPRKVGKPKRTKKAKKAAEIIPIRKEDHKAGGGLRKMDKEKHRESARKGGIASGEARRAKRDAKLGKNEHAKIGAEILLKMQDVLKDENKSAEVRLAVAETLLEVALGEIND